MTNRAHTLIRMEHNGFHLVSCGRTLFDADASLFTVVKILFVGASLFNETTQTSSSDFDKLANDAIDSAGVSGKKKVFNLSGMADILDGRLKISQMVSDKTNADTLRYWACLWNIADRGAPGIVSAEPVIDDLRWLVTDEGFYITKSHPSRNLGTTIDEQGKTLEEFKNHLSIAIKLGASAKVINELEAIVNDLSVLIGEAQGSFDHLSTEQLEQKLMGKLGADAFLERAGNRFVIRGPSVDQLKELIAQRKVSIK
jgi:hypothetical protein